MQRRLLIGRQYRPLHTPLLARCGVHTSTARHANQFAPSGALNSFGKPKRAAAPAAVDSAAQPAATPPPPPPPTAAVSAAPIYTPASRLQSRIAPNANAADSEFDATSDDASDASSGRMGGATPLDIVEVDLLSDADLNEDGTLKQPPQQQQQLNTTASDGASRSLLFDMSPASIRAGFDAKVHFFRSHNYHHSRLSVWPGHWTTNQNIILEYRKMQIDFVSLQSAPTIRGQLLLKWFYKFRHLDLWAKLHSGYLHMQHDKVLVRRTLWCIHRQSMCQELFNPSFFGVPNDYQGRLIVRCLHLWIVQHKLKVSNRLREGPRRGESAEAYAAREDKHRKAYIKLLFDNWWSSVRKSQVAHGTPMMLQDKTAKQSQKKFFALMLMLDRCMKMREDGDPEAESAFLGVLWRNVYGGQCENKHQLRALQRYLLANFVHFTRLTDDEAFCGNLTWAPFPREPLPRDIEPIEKGEYDTPMMERGQYVELNPDYKR